MGRTLSVCCMGCKLSFCLLRGCFGFCFRLPGRFGMRVPCSVARSIEGGPVSLQGIRLEEAWQTRPANWGLVPSGVVLGLVPGIIHRWGQDP